MLPGLGLIAAVLSSLAAFAIVYAIVFGAGTPPAPYRLSDSFPAREIDLLFESIRRSLSWLDAHEGQKPPAWEDAATPAAPEKQLGLHPGETMAFEVQLGSFTISSPRWKITATATAQRSVLLSSCSSYM